MWRDEQGGRAKEYQGYFKSRATQDITSQGGFETEPSPKISEVFVARAPRRLKIRAARTRAAAPVVDPTGRTAPGEQPVDSGRSELTVDNLACFGPRSAASATLRWPAFAKPTARSWTYKNNSNLVSRKSRRRLCEGGQRLRNRRSDAKPRLGD